MNKSKFQTPGYLRVASLVLSVLATIVIFGGVAVGLTWDAGFQALA